MWRGLICLSAVASAVLVSPTAAQDGSPASRFRDAFSLCSVPAEFPGKAGFAAGVRQLANGFNLEDAGPDAWDKADIGAHFRLTPPSTCEGILETGDLKAAMAAVSVTLTDCRRTGGAATAASFACNGYKAVLTLEPASRPVRFHAVVTRGP